MEEGEEVEGEEEEVLGWGRRKARLVLGGGGAAGVAGGI